MWILARSIISFLSVKYNNICLIVFLLVSLRRWSLLFHAFLIRIVRVCLAHILHMFLLNYDNQYFGKYFLSFALHNCVFSRCLNAFSFPLLVFVCLSFPFLALLFSGFCYKKIPMLDLKLVVVLWFCVFFYYFHKVPICFAEGS